MTTFFSAAVRDWLVWKSHGAFKGKGCCPCTYITQPTSWSHTVQARNGRCRVPPIDITATPNSYSATPLSFNSARNSSVLTASDVTCEAILKAIPRKRVKGNEQIIWTERDAGAQGIDHPNIVRSVSPRLFSFSSMRLRRYLSPNMFGCLPVGQVLRRVQVTDNIPPWFRARCRQRTL